MRITKPVRLALALFSEQGVMTARQFAALRWREGFEHSVSAVGRRATGAIRGAGATMKAGAFLRRLEGAGLLSTGLRPRQRLNPPRRAMELNVALVEYEITAEGREALAQAAVRAAKYGRPGPRRRTA